MIVGFIVVIVWLGWIRDFNWVVFWLLVLVLVVYIFVLFFRMIIFGWLFVMNLYFFVVFIGWGVVIISFIFELMFCIGLGNILGSVFGFFILLIVYGFLIDDDIFKVFEVVFDM